MLWFDVEKRYNTTNHSNCFSRQLLWFDVEKRYNTTHCHICHDVTGLWFDVEKRYNTTVDINFTNRICCGLM